MKGKKYIKQAKNRAKSGRRVVGNQAKRGRSSLEYAVDGAKSGTKRAYALVVQLIVTYAIIVGLLFIASFGLLEIVGVDTGIPSEFTGYAIYFSYGIILCLVPAELIRQKIARRQIERLSITDPENGDTGYRELPPALWETLGVKSVFRDDDTGKLTEAERDKDHLHRIEVDTDDGARTGWECEYYDDATNTAYVSYYGGVSGTEIRRAMKEGMEQLKLEASVEREWNEGLRRHFFAHFEDAVSRRVNHIVAIIEGERVPGDESVREFIDRKTKGTDVEDILEFGAHPRDEIEGENPFESERTSEMLNNRGDSHE